LAWITLLVSGGRSSVKPSDAGLLFQRATFFVRLFSNVGNDLGRYYSSGKLSLQVTSLPLSPTRASSASTSLMVTLSIDRSWASNKAAAAFALAPARVVLAFSST
jgi:hypothetical protein